MRTALSVRTVVAAGFLAALGVVMWGGPGLLVLALVAGVAAVVVFVVWTVPSALTVAGGLVVLVAAVSPYYLPAPQVWPRLVAAAVLLTGALLVADVAETLPPGASPWPAVGRALRGRAGMLALGAVAVAAVAVVRVLPVPGSLALATVGMAAALVALALAVRRG